MPAIMANCHLVILKRPYLDAILNGRKTIESRLTKTKCSPFGKVKLGDKLFLKESGRPVCATAAVAAVKYYENLPPTEIIEIKRQYNRQIAGSEEYWQNKADCPFGFLVWLTDVQPIEPMKIYKKDWRAWVVLTEKQDFGLLKKP